MASYKPEIVKANMRRWRERDPEGFKLAGRRSRLKEYGLTLEDYDRMVLNQRSRCVICQQVKPLVVDHDHATGKVRALLCQLCNSMLGMAGDSTAVLSRAKVYVEKWRKNHATESQSLHAHGLPGQ